MTEQPQKTAETDQRGDRKTRRGYVVSDKMDKTVVVQLQDNVTHALYGKAHDEANECGVGDLVRIAETRPLSAQKNWRIVEIVEKAK